jgi:hypothetical protein
MNMQTRNTNSEYQQSPRANTLWLGIFFVAALLMPSLRANAQLGSPQGFTIQGNILDGNGNPEEAASVVFNIQVKSTTAGCLLYSETQTLDMVGSGGNFSFILGKGVRSGTNFENTSSLQTAFDNGSGTLSGLTCATGNSYTPGVGDSRNIFLSFNDGTGVHYVTQPLAVMSVPYALNADKVQGLSPSNLLILATVPTLTQANVENVFSPTNYPKLTSLIANSSVIFQLSANGAAPMPAEATTPNNLSAGQVWFDSSNGVMKFYDGVSVLTFGNTTSVNGSAISTGTIQGATAINTTGNIQTTGSITGSKTYLYDHSGAGPGYVGLQSPANMVANGGASYIMTLPNTAGASGQVLATDGSGILSWVNRAGALSGTAPVQIGGTAQSPTISVSAATTSASGVVTLASSGGTTAGTVVQATDSRLSDSRAPSGTASGDLSGSYPNPSVAKILGTSVSATPTTGGQVLRYDGTNYTPNFVSMFDLRSTITGNQAFGGVGCTAGQTLTWTALTDNLSCTNIAITDSQLTYANKNANNFFAAPNGSSGAPSFRSIVLADLPTSSSNTASTVVNRDASGNFSAGTITAALTGNATTSTTATNLSGGSAGTIAYQTGAGATSMLAAGTSGYVLGSNGAAAPSWVNATNANTASAIVKRDASGNFSAGTITAALSGNATTATTATNIAGGAAGGIPYQSGAATTAVLAAGTSGYVLTSGGAGAPSWVAFSPSNVTTTQVSSNASFYPLFVASTTNGSQAVNLGTGLNFNPSTNTLTTTNLAGALAVPANSNVSMASGTGTFTQTYTGTTAAAHSITANSLTSGSILSLSSSSTAAAAGNTGLGITVSGTNATSSITRYGMQSAVTATGTSSTNIAGYFSASGGANNYALIVPSTGGSVGIGNSAPTATLDVSGHIANSGGAATVTTCGTSPSITGNDTRGTVTLGTGSPTTCTVTFATSYATAPYCVITPFGGNPGAIQWWISATGTGSFTMSFSATPTASQKFMYYCMQ